MLKITQQREMHVKKRTTLEWKKFFKQKNYTGVISLADNMYSAVSRKQTIQLKNQQGPNAFSKSVEDGYQST